MPSRFRISLLSAFAVVILLASCSKSNKQGRYIPKDAAIVLHINGESLSAKLPWDEIKGNAVFQQMYADSTMPAFAKKVLDNPENIGINTKSDLVFFGLKDSLGAYIAFAGNIKDAEKFRLFNIDLTEGGSETKDGDNSFISKAPMCVGWNKERFVYIVNTPDLNPELRMKRYSDEGDNASSTSPRDVGATCKSIFALKESNSLGSDDKFSTLVKKEGDVHFWMNAEQVQMNPGGMMGGIGNMQKLYAGSYTTATANFENGKVTIDAKSYAGKELRNIYKKYTGNKINEEMIKRLPSKDVAAVFAVNFKPQGIIEVLKVMGMEAMANIGLAMMGISMDDIVKATKGDFVVAISDFKPVTDSVTTWVDGKITRQSRTKTEPEVIFATSIGDKDAFNRLLKAGEKASKNRMGDNVNYNSNEKYFAAGSSRENVDKYLAGSSDNKYDFLSKINGGPIGGYVNIQFILKAMEADIKADSDSAKAVIYDASLKLWSDAYVTGGNYSDGGVEQHFEINLMDKSTNSLKQLNQYFGKVAQIMEERKKHYGMVDIDSISVRPSVVEPTVQDAPVKKQR